MSDRIAALEALLDEQADIFMARTSASLAALRRNVRHLPLAVASSFQSHYPYPMVIDRGEGQWCYDVDGNRYLDLHGGFGCNIFGHAHPEISLAITRRAASGTHFASPTPQLGDYARVLCDRVGMDQMRLCNSGTEATMDAIRLARAATGRTKVMKVEGTYHGHHDVALMSVKPNPTKAGPATAPKTLPASQGIPESVRRHVVVAPFNDAAAARALFDRHVTKAGRSQIACVILEPVMCNLGLIRPRDGYLQALRDLCDEHGALLIFDQVKTGITIAPGGAQQVFGVQPDLHCLGKAIGGGCAIGAFGGRREHMKLIEDWKAPHYGTFAGNPLSVAAGLAALTEVLTPDAYAHIDELTARLLAGARATIDRYGLACYADAIGAKGGVFFSAQPPHDYRSWHASTDRRLAQLYWLWMVNSGVWLPPGADEQWTLPCVMDLDDCDLYLETFEDFAQVVADLPAD